MIMIILAMIMIMKMVLIIMRLTILPVSTLMTTRRLRWGRMSKRRRLKTCEMRLLEWVLRRFCETNPRTSSRAIEGTTDEPQGSLRNEPSAISEAVGDGSGGGNEAAGMVALAVLRNEPKDVSRPIEGTTDEPQGSLRNEPTVISEAVAVGRGKGEVEDEVVRNERGAVRSVRFDGGLTGVVRGAQQLLRPGIGLRDAVRLGNRGGGDGEGSRRERRLRKKLSVVSS